MERVYYAKICAHGIAGTPFIEEAFFQADSYSNAAEKIEKYYGVDLISFQVYAFINSMLFVSDIKDYLDEAREAFKE